MNSRRRFLMSAGGVAITPLLAQCAPGSSPVATQGVLPQATFTNTYTDGSGNPLTQNAARKVLTTGVGTGGGTVVTQTIMSPIYVTEPNGSVVARNGTKIILTTVNDKYIPNAVDFTPTGAPTFVYNPAVPEKTFVYNGITVNVTPTGGNFVYGGMYCTFTIVAGVMRVTLDSTVTTYPFPSSLGTTSDARKVQSIPFKQWGLGVAALLLAVVALVIAPEAGIVAVTAYAATEAVAITSIAFATIRVFIDTYDPTTSDDYEAGW